MTRILKPLTFLLDMSRRIAIVRLCILFYIVHPGTSATFADAKTFLETRYPNRDLLPLEGSFGYYQRSCKNIFQGMLKLMAGTFPAKLPRSYSSFAPYKPLEMQHRFIRELCFVRPPIPLKIRNAQLHTGNVMQTERWQALAETQSIGARTSPSMSYRYDDFQNGRDGFKMSRESPPVFGTLETAYDKTLNIVDRFLDRVTFQSNKKGSNANISEFQGIYVNQIDPVGMLDIDPWEASSRSNKGKWW
mmetsp:Transcript_10872/g.16063  ORF Transcript_10872/g.16063 Transcript_10872/m.16063 type:complete len:247 (+) Transcript_10872:138-878(+)